MLLGLLLAMQSNGCKSTKGTFHELLDLRRKGRSASRDARACSDHLPELPIDVARECERLRKEHDEYRTTKDL